MNAMTSLQTDAPESQTSTQPETSVLTPEARAFLLKLAARFEPRRQELLARRQPYSRRSIMASFRTFCRRRLEFAKAIGRLRRSRRICWIAVWKLPGRSIAR